MIFPGVFGGQAVVCGGASKAGTLQERIDVRQIVDRAYCTPYPLRFNCSPIDVAAALVESFISLVKMKHVQPEKVPLLHTYRVYRCFLHPTHEPYIAVRASGGLILLNLLYSYQEKISPSPSRVLNDRLVCGRLRA